MNYVTKLVKILIEAFYQRNLESFQLDMIFGSF